MCTKLGGHRVLLLFFERFSLYVISTARYSGAYTNTRSLDSVVLLYHNFMTLFYSLYITSPSKTRKNTTLKAVLWWMRIRPKLIGLEHTENALHCSLLFYVFFSLCSWKSFVTGLLIQIIKKKESNFWNRY